MIRWSEAALGDVAEISRSVVEPRDLPPETKYLGLEHIERGGRIIGVATVESENVSSSKFEFSEGDILYGKLRPYLGKIAAPEFAGVCSTDILPVRPGRDLERRYLLHYLRQPKMVELANSRATGANLPRLAPKELAKIRIPLPSLAEQRRIAAVLDQVDTLRAKRREAITLLDDLARSIFLDMFGDPVSCNSLWDRKTIGELGAVVTGNTPSRAKSENYGEGIEWIKTDNIRPPELNPSRAAERLTVAGEKAGRVVPAESILVTCIAGSPASIGNAVLAGRRVAINQQINAFIPQGPLPRFMLEQIRVGKALIQQKSTGAMTGLVNKTQFSSISLMVPPVGRQQEFVRRVECVDSQRARNVRHLAALDELFSSLQHRAFSGTLWDHEAPGEAA
ncbi:restriction endonuclease subunit S [Streptomyces sp. 2BBP-J2]|uniref:restriction endonuclease subunit S n=1 Tax=Streptomyces sp. 2BBP-J2 TaxID=2719381 RepID=UPI00142F7DAA|nr:restriction endonuclease subunit S [Streptomyces sp. 2BBP-J2]NIL50080.1 restriction endonuclease subunit S [Streptomyces sp. 2BBP-J2]